MAGFADKIEEVGIALVILAILVGQVALPIFFDVNTSLLGMSTTQVTIWGTILTLTFLGIGLGAIGYMRSARKGR